MVEGTFRVWKKSMPAATPKKPTTKPTLKPTPDGKA